jgi:RNA polymerase sigma-70 factor, ECF subfamily
MDEEIRTHLDQGQYAEAFELVMGRYQNKVFRLAYAMLGNRALAEDAAQEIFVRIWRALPGYRGLATISTWIFAIARNACLTAGKAGAGRKALSLDEPEVRIAAEAQHAVAPAALHGADLNDLIAGLPDNYRQVITLFYMEEKSYIQVAQLLDLPMGTVKTYLHRAKKELAAAVIESKMKGGKC